MKRRFFIIAAICLAGLLAVGCSSAKNNTAPQTAPAPSASSAAYEGIALEGGFAAEAEEQGYSYDMAAESPREAAGEILPIEPPAGGVALNAEESDRKIIYTADVGLQTKEFDESLAWVEEITRTYKGFVQSSSIQGRNLYDRGGRQGARSASFTLRIPESGMRSLIAELENQFNVNYSNIYSDDITGAYFDTQARLDSLRVQQERLLEMLEQAESVEYLLEVQKELARVGYEIESLTSSLNRMKDSVAYSTVNLSIEEVVEYTAPDTIHTPFVQRIGNAFSDAWKNFASFCQELVLWLVAATPFLVVVIPVAVVAAVVLRRRRFKASSRMLRKTSRQPKAEEENKAEDSPEQ